MLSTEAQLAGLLAVSWVSTLWN